MNDELGHRDVTCIAYTEYVHIYSLESTSCLLTFEFQFDFRAFLYGCIDEIFVVIVSFIAHYVRFFRNFSAPIYLENYIAYLQVFIFMIKFVWFCFFFNFFFLSSDKKVFSYLVHTFRIAIFICLSTTEILWDL